MSFLDKYVFYPKFEQEVVYHCLISKGFFSSLAPYIAVEAFPSKEAQFLVGLCKVRFDENGGQFGTLAAIGQELELLSSQKGKISIDQKNDYISWIMDATEQEHTDVDSAYEDFKKVITPVLEAQLTLATVTKNPDRNKLFVSLMALEISKLTVGGDGEDASDGIIEKLSKERGDIRKIPTECSELDRLLDVGFEVPSLVTVVAQSGGGKSLFLSQMAVGVYKRGGLALIASTEMSVHNIQTRFVGDITDIPFNEIKEGRDSMAKIRYKDRTATYRGGALITVLLDGLGGTVAALREWALRMQEKHKKPITLISVDYGDKMKARPGPESTNSSVTYQQIWTDLFDLSVELDCAVIVGSQAKNKGASPYFTQDHCTQSMWKPCLSTYWLTLNKNPDGFFFNLDKSRNGNTGIVGPITRECEFGRLTARNDSGTSPLTSASSAFNNPGGILMVPTGRKNSNGKP